MVSEFDEEYDWLVGELDWMGTLLMAVPDADVAAALTPAPAVRDSEAPVMVRGPSVALRVSPRAKR